MSNSRVRKKQVAEEKPAMSRQKSAMTSAQASGVLTDSFSGTLSDIEFCDKSGFFRRQKKQQRSLVAQLAQKQGNRHSQRALTALAEGAAAQNSSKEHSGVELSNQAHSSYIIMTKPAKQLQKDLHADWRFDQPGPGWSLRTAIVKVPWSNEFSTLYDRVITILITKPAFASFAAEKLGVIGPALHSFLIDCENNQISYEENSVVRLLVRSWADPSNVKLAENTMVGMAMVQTESRLPVGRGEQKQEKQKPQNNAPLGIRLKIANWESDYSFTEAVNTLENHTQAEISAILSRDRLNKDQWFCSYVSELYTGIDLPNIDELRYVLKILGSARKSLEEAKTNSDLIASKELIEDSFKLLQLAAWKYNQSHEKWVDYKKNVVVGAERAKRTVEVMIVVLSAATGGVGGTMIKTPSIFNYAATQATLTMTEKLGLQFGMSKYGEEMDVLDIIGKTSSAFLSSIMGGRLAEHFFGKWKTVFTANGIAPPKSMEVLVSRLGRHTLELLLNQSLDALRGKDVSVEDVLDKLVEKIAATIVDTISTLGP
jgi:hypothetical protein